MIRAAILGATGYTARELLDLLLRHPEVEVTALTTRQDLSLGIGAAVRAVLAGSDVAAGDIAMTSLSTTVGSRSLFLELGGKEEGCWLSKS